MKLRMAALVVALFAFVAGPVAAAGARETAEQPWEIAGTLTEACTCSVPCTCNFGQGPSPHHYCHTVFSLQIERGHFGAVKLDGLHFAFAHAQKDWVGYIDDRASHEQADALKAVGAHILASFGAKADFETARITQEAGDRSARVQIGERGGFETDYIMGMDKKTPVVVENNTSLNIPRSTKTKTKVFRYQDTHGNSIDTAATNGNQGKFDWTDQTVAYIQ